MTTAAPECPACGGRETHPTSSLAHTKSSRPEECSRCGWLAWEGEDTGCDRCRMHWPRGRRLTQRTYSVPRAALLLGVTAVEVKALLESNPHLDRGERTALPKVDRLAAHGLALLCWGPNGA